jgi:uncharacterized membrane protein
MTVNEDVGIKEDIENEEEVAVMTFKNGETILDLNPIYRPAFVALEEAKEGYNSIIGGSTGGGSFLFIIIIITIIFLLYRRRRNNRNKEMKKQVEEDDRKEMVIKQLRMENRIEEGIFNLHTASQMYPNLPAIMHTLPVTHSSPEGQVHLGQPALAATVGQISPDQQALEAHPAQLFLGQEESAATVADIKIELAEQAAPVSKNFMTLGVSRG